MLNTYEFLIEHDLIKNIKDKYNTIKVHIFSIL